MLVCGVGRSIMWLWKDKPLCTHGWADPPVIPVHSSCRLSYPPTGLRVLLTLCSSSFAKVLTSMPRKVRVTAGPSVLWWTLEVPWWWSHRGSVERGQYLAVTAPSKMCLLRHLKMFGADRRPKGSIRSTYCSSTALLVVVNLGAGLELTGMLILYPHSALGPLSPSLLYNYLPHGRL